MANSINLAFPLQRGTQGPFATNDDTFNAVADDLRILLITNHGERPIQYDFGTNLRGLVFEFEGEQLNQAIKDRIVSAIDKWLPFVTIKNMKIDSSNTNSTIKSNQVTVTIEFGIGNIDVTKVLTQRVNL
jgi:phage baseplate assembly protein W